MKRWRIFFAIALLASVGLLFTRGSDPSMLQDTDTAFLLSKIRDRNAPLSWFTGDWPLENHFYRPIPSLSFEADNALHGNRAEGYGWTNAVICALCCLALFWFVRELTDSPPFTLACTLIFSWWNSGLWMPAGSDLFNLGLLAAMLICLLGFWRHGLQGRFYIPAALIAIFVATILHPDAVIRDVNGYGLWYRTVGWLPGRTATIMTLFALLSMACYASYVRRASTPSRPAPTALDEPTATRTSAASTVQAPPKSWLIVSLAGAALAMLSYEQGIMVPALLVGVALFFRIRGYRVDWKPLALAWSLLLAYFAARFAFVPSGTSRYQAQQYRSGSNIAWDLSAYFLPNLAHIRALENLGVGILALLSASVYQPLLGFLAAIASFLKAQRQWLLALAGIGLSSVAYLPMGWLKQFGHYHYLPMALRTIFVVAMVQVLWEQLSIAVCRPTRQAPRRPSPAPGSLPRP